MGVKRQEDDCRALAKRNGWQVVQVFTDNDASAFSGKKRPQYLELIRRIKDKEFDVLIAWHNDRIHRSPRELEDFIDICEATKLSVVTVQAGNFNLGTSSGRAIARIHGAIARQSSEQSSDRIKRKALEVAMAGKPWGGKARIYGFEANQITIVESEAEAIRKVAQRFLAGEGLNSLCRWLNESGYRTVLDNKFTYKSLKDILRSARISGRREFHGEIVAKAMWDAIITPEESDAIRAMMINRATPYVSGRKNLLTGILVCGKCGEKLVSSSKDGRGRYVCRMRMDNGKGCGGTFIFKDLVDVLIGQAVITRLNSPVVERALKNKQSQPKALSAYKELSVITDRELELAEMFAKGEVSRVEVAKAKKVLNERKYLLEKNLSIEMGASMMASEMSSPQLIASSWSSLNLDRQRAILKSMLESITINKPVKISNKFDPTRVVPLWRF